jgi:hypothetical protein
MEFLGGEYLFTLFKDVRVLLDVLDVKLESITEDVANLTVEAGWNLRLIFGNAE